ncbi:WD40-like Beta Propeller Repeat [Micromonospora inositola]|uniref:WD40-like Beta Propeller Repeat n=2 Tax=Micromonospora inositola TaxID=47865 RepID=A0A1C5JQ78_9ACTN|nr:WD40-like Beta Propeller Repeat [Micromonospora inositola]
MRNLRIGLTILTTTTVTLVGIHAVPAAATAPTTTRVSVSSSGTQANNHSGGRGISPDGRWVAFASEATNLVPGDTNGRSDIFVRDRATGTTERVSVATGGAQSTGAQFTVNSTDPVISADGRYVAFVSDAANLVPGDTNFTDDVFLRDRTAGTTTRISVSTAGAEGDYPSYEPTISADGRYIAYTSWATNLVPGDENWYSDIMLWDRIAATTTRISVSTTGGDTYGESRQPAITPDGRYVAFTSTAPNMTTPPTNNYDEIFVRDLATATTSAMSYATNGAEANSDSYRPAISADGRYVSYYSYATNLVAGDTNGRYDIFLRDRVTATTTRISVATGGAQANMDSYTSAISADGRYVVFDSGATNLVAGDTNGYLWDVYLRDRVAGTTTRISVSTAGTQGDSQTGGPSISANGRLIFFSGVATNLVPNDTNGAADVFLRDLGT